MSLTPLRLLRRWRTLTQKDMARLLGLNQASYSKYESGKVAVPFNLQIRIATILGVLREEAFPDPDHPRAHRRSA